VSEKIVTVQELGREIIGAIYEAYKPKFEELTKEVGITEGIDNALTQYAVAFTPDALGLAHVFSLAPYSNPEGIKQDFIGAVERGWLQVAGEGAYIPSEKSKDYLNRLRDMLNEVFAELQEETSQDLMRINELLAAIVEEADKTKAFTDKPTLKMTRRFEPKGKVPELNWVRRHLFSIFSFRDDAHIAAWAPQKIDGYAWETLSFLWEGEAGTPTQLAEKLAENRNYDEEAYAGALKELDKRGWVKEINGSFEVTEEGRTLRQKVEDLTDEYFNSAFAIISDSDLEELGALLGQLAKDLIPVVEEAEVS
jgi:DNA-binding MarR family transcriptional regulator